MDPAVQLPKTLPLLQIFRGAAATFVVLFHVTWHGRVLHPEYFAAGAFMFGHSGVDFFFVLSGFIMVYAHAADAGCRGRAWRFAKARVARIFPAYWVILALTLACYAWRPEFADYGAYALNLATAGRSLILYDQLRHPVVPVAWSLSYELAFYGFFILFFIVPPRMFAAAAVIWCGAIVTPLLAGAQRSAPTLLSTFVLEFFLGCLAALIVLRWRPTMRAGALLAAAVPWLVVAFADAAGYIDTNRNVRNFALPYTVLILAAACYDLRRTHQYPRVLLRLGDASYAVFLVHYLVVQNAIFWIGAHPGVAATIGWQSTLALLSAVIVALGVAFHFTIERPLHARTRRMLVKERGAPYVVPVRAA